MVLPSQHTPARRRRYKIPALNRKERDLERGSRRHTAVDQYDFDGDLSSGRCLGLVRWPSQLDRNRGNKGKENARKLGMTGPDHSCQVEFPGPEANRSSDQTRY